MEECKRSQGRGCKALGKGGKVQELRVDTAGVPIFKLGLKVFLNVNAKYNICLTI